MDVSWYGGVCKIPTLNFYLVNVLAFRSKKHLGKYVMEGFVQIKRGAVKKGLKSNGFSL
jgi:hypothetical protein